MAKNTQHVVHHPDGGWSVVKGGATRATRRFRTKRAAIDFAREVSKKQGAELYLHRRNGLVHQKDSYRGDPVLPKGSR